VHYPLSSYPYYVTKLVDLTCFSLFYIHVTERNTIKESSISKWLKLDPVFYLTESMAVADTLRMMMDSSSMVLHPMRRRTFILRLADTRLIIMEEEAIMAPLDVIEHFKSQVFMSFKYNSNSLFSILPSQLDIAAEDVWISSSIK
jgi:hypothetical protein